ncbi:MAG: M4 family metallopeptidase [Actinomycetota bacterium]
MTTICSIVPPHVLKQIAKNGTERQRDRALRAVSMAGRLRERRQILGSMRFGFTPCGELRRTGYDAKHLEVLPGTRVRGEGDAAVEDVDVNEAYDGAGSTYDFYREVLNRNSIDDQGMRLDSTVHYSVDMDNAFWDGTQMVYGDGDGEIFERFTAAIDVIGHEMTHGVTQFTANLEYRGQSGALNESNSDVIGTLVKQWSLKQTVDEADWLIGEGLLMPNVKGRALRSMKAPGTAFDDPVLGKDPQPDHMSRFVTTTADRGGVHINSGIPNRAFYLAAASIGGYAWEEAGKIWYQTLTQRLRRDSQFTHAAAATISAAGDLFGEASSQQEAVRDAWEQTGVLDAA